jgi:hypothetical protein
VAIERFYQVDPTREACWRSIILFGRNVASYKFALGKALIDVAGSGSDLVSLDDLALPFAKNICGHLKNSDKQATSASSRFLDQCRAFNRGESSEDQLRDQTRKRGFQNVIDAFHVVNRDNVPVRFFEDERKTNQGLRITDELRFLAGGDSSSDLSQEI